MRLAAVVLLLATGCGQVPSAAPSTAATEVGTPQAMEDVACEGLLTRAEVEAVVGGQVVSLGRRASSCHWLRGGQVVQLVFNTSDFVARWREELLQTYTQRVDANGADVWAEPGGESVAAFRDDRGVIVHGVPDRASAVGLALLALGRL